MVMPPRDPLPPPPLREDDESKAKKLWSGIDGIALRFILDYTVADAHADHIPKESLSLLSQWRDTGLSTSARPNTGTSSAASTSGTRSSGNNTISARGAGIATVPSTSSIPTTATTPVRPTSATVRPTSASTRPITASISGGTLNGKRGSIPLVIVTGTPRAGQLELLTGFRTHASSRTRLHIVFARPAEQLECLLAWRNQPIGACPSPSEPTSSHSLVTQLENVRLTIENYVPGEGKKPSDVSHRVVVVTGAQDGIVEFVSSLSTLPSVREGYFNISTVIACIRPSTFFVVCHSIHHITASLSLMISMK
jgi:hypothetical protein